MDARRKISRPHLYRIGNQIKQQLFGNKTWKLDYKSMVTLLDIISKDDRCPTPYNIPYGMAIDATNNARNLLYRVVG